METGACGTIRKLMQLDNPFPLRVRVLYMDCHACFLCGRNYPLELHHIFGRDYDCAFNAAVLCKKCHDAVLHTRAEHSKLFFLNIEYLLKNKYQPIENDYEMVKKESWLANEPKWAVTFST